MYIFYVYVIIFLSIEKNNEKFPKNIIRKKIFNFKINFKLIFYCQFRVQFKGICHWEFLRFPFSYFLVNEICIRVLIKSLCTKYCD